MSLIWYTILIFAAFGGFLLSFYIHHKKTAREKMICPLDSDCDAVIYSHYSNFFGVPVEILGLLYYGAVALSYALFIVFPTLVTPLITFGILTVTTSAFLFSLYLTFIQAFAIKQWCTWCLTSAGLCTVIFSSALFVSEFSFISLLSLHHNYVLIFHVLGTAIGLGAATITDIFFFKFLKDFRISESEAEVMRTLSQVIWFALALLVLTGIGLYLPEAAELSQTPKFLVKMIIVTVIIFNGVFLNLLVAPQLVKISFHELHRHEAGGLRHVRKVAFALGAISIVSWYSAFILGSLREIKGSFSSLFLLYLIAVAIAIFISQMLEGSFAKRAGSSAEIN